MTGCPAAGALKKGDALESHYINIAEARELLPAWFVPRMMDDVWSFGLLVTGGIVLAVQSISDVRQAADGSIWLDVEMMEDASFVADVLPMKIVCAPTDRCLASVNAAHVVWAFELANT